MADPKQKEPVGRIDYPGMNRRATVRYRCETLNAGRAFIANSSKSLQAQVVDISVGGIGLILERELASATLLRIELSMGASEQQLVDLAAHVCHIVPLEDGRWRHGCEWVRALTEGELLVLRGRP